MKIAKIESHRLNIPLRETYQRGGMVIFDRSMIAYVKVVADDGTTGAGTASTVTSYAGMTLETILDALSFLSPLIIGMDPFNIEAIHQVMNNRLLGNTPAKSAIDLALYDLMGKSTGKAVNQLLGGRVRDEFVTDRALTTDGKSVEQIVDSAVMAVEDGYRGFEIHVGPELDRNVSVVKGIREALPDVVLVGDAHQIWSVKEAIRNIRALQRYDIYFEQPTRGIENMAEVKRATEAIITADESCFTAEDALRIILNRAADCLTVKLAKAGGLYPAKKIVALAEAAGLLVRVDGVPGDTRVSNTAAAHLALTVPRLMPGSGVMQHRYWLKEDFSLKGGLVLKDGKVTVPDEAGIGVVPNEAILERASDAT
jgi:L-Ala-D/L-Glu epimerase